MKMIGVCAERLRLRISAAVSKPSMPGMLTSSRITAKSRSSTCLSASSPEPTATTFWPSSSRTVRKTRSLSARSSTTRIAAGASAARSGSPAVSRIAHGLQPGPQGREQLLRVDRLRQVVPRARLEAALAVALHRLRGHRDDRQVLAAGELADLAHGLQAVHLRHHDVHQHDVDVGLALHDLDRVAAVVGGEDAPCRSPRAPSRARRCCACRRRRSAPCGRRASWLDW